MGKKLSDRAAVQLITKYDRYFHKICQSFVPLSYYRYDDLYAAARQGFFEGLLRYDEGKGAQPHSYGYYWAFARVARAFRSFGVTSKGTTTYEEEGSDLFSSLQDEKNGPDQIRGSVDYALVREKVLLLPARERFIVSSYFGLNGPQLVMEEIGELLEVTRERIRQIINEALIKLRLLLGE